MNSIIQQLQRKRKTLKLSQKALGSKLGLPQSHISSIESGKTDPRVSTLQDMARLLDMELIAIPREQLVLIESLLSGNNRHQLPRFLPDEDEDDADNENNYS